MIYQPHEDTGFVGEGKIKQILFADDPMKFYEIFGDKIFLSKEEMKEYVKSQERCGRTVRKKRWMAIEIEGIKKYERIVKPKRFISVGGQF